MADAAHILSQERYYFPDNDYTNFTDECSEFLRFIQQLNSRARI